MGMLGKLTTEDRRAEHVTSLQIAKAQRDNV